MPREALFDLAVNRAYRYALRLGVLGGDGLKPALTTWYRATRFAYRIPLDAILNAVAAAPGEGYHWRGGPQGGWQPGQPPHP
jgi:hypothetical protein